MNDSREHLPPLVFKRKQRFPEPIPGPLIGLVLSAAAIVLTCLLAISGGCLSFGVVLLLLVLLPVLMRDADGKTAFTIFLVTLMWALMMTVTCLPTIYSDSTHSVRVDGQPSDVEPASEFFATLPEQIVEKIGLLWMVAWLYVIFSGIGLAFNRIEHPP